MTERVYTEHPELYDAIQSEWEYDRDVSFVLAAMERHGVAGDRLLEIGCGTGEHTWRFVEEGFDVTAVDGYEGMLDRARGKCDATFRQATLPDLPDVGEFDVVVALRGVINHLPPNDLEPSMDAIRERLTDGGLAVFDNSRLPADGNEPALDVGETPHGSYGRIVQMCPRPDGRLDWQSIVFLPDAGEFFVNSREMTPFDDRTLRESLAGRGLTVETHDGFGPDDRRTVFVVTTSH